MKSCLPVPPLSFLFGGDTDFKRVGCEKCYLYKSYETNDDESWER